MIGKFIAKTTLRLALTGIGLAIGVPLLSWLFIIITNIARNMIVNDFLNRMRKIREKK